MPKKRKNKKSSSNFKIAYIFLILIFAAGITFLALSAFFPQQKEDEGDNLNTVVNTTEQQKENTSTPVDDEEVANNKTPKQNEEEPDDTKEAISADITKNEVVNGKYLLRVTIYELLDSGTCTLHMESTKGDTVDRTANIIQAGADTSSCEGFDIPASGISSGAYNFTLTVKSNGKENAITGKINI